MGQNPSTSGPAVTESQDPAQIQREIEQTRAQLGDTVEALSHKADVKAQARQAAHRARQNPARLAVVAAFAVGFLAIRAFRK